MSIAMVKVNAPQLNSADSFQEMTQDIVLSREAGIKFEARPTCQLRTTSGFARYSTMHPLYTCYYISSNSLVNCNTNSLIYKHGCTISSGSWQAFIHMHSKSRFWYSTNLLICCLKPTNHLPNLTRYNNLPIFANIPIV